MLSVIKTVTIISCLSFLSTEGFAQEAESDGMKHSLTIEVPRLFLKTISVSYNYKINNKYELRFNPRISFDSQLDNSVLGVKLIKDPFWYYNSYMLQVGLSRNWHTVYIEPMVYYQHASFEDRGLQMTDQEGDAYDVYANLNREYNGGGIAFRSGLKMDKNHFRFNFFYGIGCYVRHYHEQINWARAWVDGPKPNPPNFPVVSNYWKGGLTLHVGFEIGYRFGKPDN